jgi:LemA protein
MVWVLVLLGLLLVVVIALVVLYNRLVTLRNRVENAWAQVDVQLRRRYDLIPNLVETVKGYAAHERETFEAVTAARTRAQAAQGPAEQGAAEGILGQALGRLFAVAEAYPDLKASTNFLELQRELTETEDRIAAGRRFYNANVRALNTRVESFPSNLVASTFSFHKEEYFEVEDEAVRTAPSVDFS